jgi:pyridoxine kinase
MSSWVAHGHVGLSAAAPALQALGHSVTQLPTVQLSNHPGWPHVAGRQVPPSEIAGMVAALDANGWLSGFDAMLTGYLPSPRHVELACDLALQLRRAAPALKLVVDPVLADTLTPNSFELGWLTGHDVTHLQGTREAAARLRDLTGGADVLATSPPVSEDETGLFALTSSAALFRVPKADPATVPHGSGDVFSALIAAGLAPGAALGHLQALVAASLGAPHLRISESAGDWTRAAPLRPETIDHAAEDAVR